eukprot:gene4794-7186_t
MVRDVQRLTNMAERPGLPHNVREYTGRVARQEGERLIAWGQAVHKVPEEAGDPRGRPPGQTKGWGWAGRLATAMALVSPARAEISGAMTEYYRGPALTGTVTILALLAIGLVWHRLGGAGCKPQQGLPPTPAVSMAPDEEAGHGEAPSTQMEPGVRHSYEVVSMPPRPEKEAGAPASTPAGDGDEECERIVRQLWNVYYQARDHTGMWTGPYGSPPAYWPPEVRLEQVEPLLARTRMLAQRDPQYEPIAEYLESCQLTGGCPEYWAGDPLLILETRPTRGPGAVAAEAAEGDDEGLLNHLLEVEWTDWLQGFGRWAGLEREVVGELHTLTRRAACSIIAEAAGELQRLRGPDRGEEAQACMRSYICAARWADNWRRHRGSGWDPDEHDLRRDPYDGRYYNLQDFQREYKAKAPAYWDAAPPYERFLRQRAGRRPWDGSGDDDLLRGLGLGSDEEDPEADGNYTPLVNTPEDAAWMGRVMGEEPCLTPCSLCTVIPTDHAQYRLPRAPGQFRVAVLHQDLTTALQTKRLLRGLDEMEAEAAVIMGTTARNPPLAVTQNMRGWAIHAAPRPLSKRDRERLRGDPPTAPVDGGAYVLTDEAKLVSELWLPENLPLCGADLIIVGLPIDMEDDSEMEWDYPGSRRRALRMWADTHHFAPPEDASTTWTTGETGPYGATRTARTITTLAGCTAAGGIRWGRLDQEPMPVRDNPLPQPQEEWMRARGRRPDYWPRFPYNKHYEPEWASPAWLDLTDNPQPREWREPVLRTTAPHKLRLKDGTHEQWVQKRLARMIKVDPADGPEMRRCIDNAYLPLFATKEQAQTVVKCLTTDEGMHDIATAAGSSIREDMEGGRAGAMRTALTAYLTAVALAMTLGAIIYLGARALPRSEAVRTLGYAACVNIIGARALPRSETARTLGYAECVNIRSSELRPEEARHRIHPLPTEKWTEEPRPALAGEDVDAGDGPRAAIQAILHAMNGNMMAAAGARYKKNDFVWYCREGKERWLARVLYVDHTVAARGGSAEPSYNIQLAHTIGERAVEAAMLRDTPKDTTHPAFMHGLKRAIIMARERLARLRQDFDTPGDEAEQEGLPAWERGQRVLRLEKDEHGRVGMRYTGPEIEFVHRGEAAERAGVRPGMWIIRVGDKLVGKSAEIKSAITEAPTTFTITVLPSSPPPDQPDAGPAEERPPLPEYEGEEQWDDESEL